MSGYLTWFACQHVPAIIDGGRWRVTPRVPIVRVCISFLNALVLVPALMCSSCGGRPPQGALIPVTATAEGTSRVPILIATTRQRSTADTGEMFSGERAAEMSYAAITVSIPPDAARKIGEVQWPVTLPGDPGTNFVTVSAEYIDKQRFAASIAATAKRTGRSKVLVFIHGSNNRSSMKRCIGLRRLCTTPEGSRYSCLVYMALARRGAVAHLQLRQGERELFTRCA